MGDKKRKQPQPNVGGFTDTNENNQNETAQKGGQAVRESNKTSDKNGDPGKGGAQGHGNRVGDEGSNRN